GHIEEDSKLCAALVQAHAPVAHRLTLLLRLAIGEAAPLGPAADHARAAAVKLLRSDAVRTELASAPGQLAQVRDMLQALALAACNRPTAPQTPGVCWRAAAAPAKGFVPLSRDVDSLENCAVLLEGLRLQGEPRADGAYAGFFIFIDADAMTSASHVGGF